MSRWRCGGCETLYALRLTSCTRCLSTTFQEEEGLMAKISRNGGASIRHVGGTTVAVHARAVLPTVAPVELTLLADQGPEPVEVDQQGGAPSAGSSSSASSPKPPTNSAPSETDRRKPARTTASRSGKARTGSSTARSTAGSGTGSATGNRAD